MIKQKFDEPKEQLEKEIKEQNNKLDPDNKMETYRFGIIYINEEDKFQMQEIDTAFNYIPDETNDSVIYMKEPTPIYNSNTFSIFVIYTKC